jgi:hypothetical protein
LYVRHLPHLINIWLSTTRRSAVDHRDQPASATMPHAPQTRSSLSLPIGNSKGWRALKSTIDAAGWGMPIVRSLVCVRVTAECFRPERRILSRQSRNQTGGRRQNSSSAVRAILDDPPIHIRPVCSRKRECEGQELCGWSKRRPNRYVEHNRPNVETPPKCGAFPFSAHSRARGGAPDRDIWLKGPSFLARADVIASPKNLSSHGFLVLIEEAALICGHGFPPRS